jgi:UDP-3-O-[3-hydroxymyristoyl] glucosamine N-acyltransferase
MQFPAQQIAQLVNGTVEGDATVTVNSFGKIEEAQNGQLSFLANPKYEEYLYTSLASIIILNTNFELKQPVTATLIRVPDAYTAFATLLSFYQTMQQQQLVGIEQPSYIEASAKVGNNVYIAAFAYIGKNVKIGNDTKIYPQAFIGENVSIGNNVIIHSGVKIYHDCVIGNNIVIHSGTIIGSDGFGFAPQADGTFKKVPQIGNVIVEDNVEIGANATIDRATIGSTLIKSGAKLDNLIQIAHNVEVGNQTVIAAQAGISGSTKLGNNVMIGGQAGIVGHIHLADGTKVNAQSGVSKSTQPNAALTGSPAGDYTSMLRSQAVMKRLPELEKRIAELEKLLKTQSI